MNQQVSRLNLFIQSQAYGLRKPSINPKVHVSQAGLCISMNTQLPGGMPLVHVHVSDLCCVLRKCINQGFLFRKKKVYYRFRGLY